MRAQRFSGLNPGAGAPGRRRTAVETAVRGGVALLALTLGACDLLLEPGDRTVGALCVGERATAAAPHPALEGTPFPVLAWYGVPKALLDPSAFEELAAAGFTLNYTPKGSRGTNLDVLDLAQGAGLRALLEDFTLRPDSAFDAAAVEEAVAAYRGHPAFFGYQLRGEPPASLFPRMSQVADAIRALDPDHVVYSNIYPDYADPARLAVPTYEEYLERFVDVVEPRVLTAAYYPFHRRGFRRGYFEFMDRLRAAAVAAGAELWGFAMTAHIEPEFPPPRESWIRFQVYAALAYGARGIAYFPYGLPRSNTEDFRLAVIDSAGVPTHLYDVVRRLNGEIHALAPVLRTLRSVRVCRSATAPDGSHIEWGLGLVRRSSGAPILLGELADSAGRPFLLLVSTDWDDEGDVALEVAESVSALVEVPRTGSGGSSRYPASEGRVTARMAPGDGRLFRVE